MSKITLIRPAYSVEIYGNVYDSQNSNLTREIRPPLGLMSLGGYLKKYGHEVVILDGEVDLWDEETTAKNALDTNPDIIGITSTTPEYPFAYRIMKKIRESSPHVITVFGGPHITNLPEHTMADLEEFVDWGVVYEGEIPLAAIANGNPDKFVFQRSGHPKLLMAPKRLSGEELNSFSEDRSILDMSKYKYVDSSIGMVQNDAIEMARGCPFGCVFCTSRKTNLSQRSIDHVLKEVLASAKKYKTKLFMFYDDTFTLKREMAVELFEKIISYKEKGDLPEDVHFYGFTRASSINDLEFLKLMKKSGCDKITLGVESGNPTILKNTKKGTKLDDYRQVYSLMDQAGITKRGSFIIGFPHETESTITETINFAIELDLDEIGVNILTPYPGQLIFRDAYEEKGIWLNNRVHYKEFQSESINWHQIWENYKRWGVAVVETEELSGEALEYWHGRFLQEVYGSKKMARRRHRQIEAGNNDSYWHRPWRINSRKKVEREIKEKAIGKPVFPEPMHKKYTYRPVILNDYQKNELDSFLNKM
jgi:anaerobic magnesium-protoporphyrin IX monomethyl ester cyclase